MIPSFRLMSALSFSALALASCANAQTGETAASDNGEMPFTVEEMGSFDEPWAIEFAPGTPVLFVTEKSGSMKFLDTTTGKTGTVSGLPHVAYGGQGGLGDIAFLASEASDVLDRRTIYLSWAKAGDGDTRGAVVGKGTLVCGEPESCSIEGLAVIWRQSPKVTGRGHYSHRISISPDGHYLYIASGERQKMQPAQDTTNNLGSIVRLNLDGTPAAGNPMADKGGVTAEIWSYGHRNILGLDWDASGRLWDVEHGPAGGDELNLVKAGANYGWPLRSNGEHYNGDPIPDHAADDGFAKPAVSWTPVIAPGDMIFYSADMFGAWKGEALITGLGSQALVRVAIDGETAREVTRYEFDARLRSVEQGPDGAIWIAQDGKDGQVLKLTAK
ncbi:PQQ-dependent sugar dehydrogenase [Erythrobacter dokdonensis]|uniref:Dehydrogenase n=1 Tax=Erythrobacter dokdonensis DSW-74 TaxID=1300349 RepID=A0A1A7BG19_9SPHN|nr:PQQ-dependent sugar dehydrogenase [Erythrobacter dokdonensis]OBV11434.1 dehydrogenase [Erythrobacter dokdonensis DSW-74]